MQLSDDLQAKVSKKKPKPNNKTKSLAKRRPGEDFKHRACSASRKSTESDKSTDKPSRVHGNSPVLVQESITLEKLDSNQTTVKNNKVSSLPTEEVTTKNNLNEKNKMDENKKSREEILAARQAKKNTKKDTNKTNLTPKIDNNAEINKNSINNSEISKSVKSNDTNKDQLPIVSTKEIKQNDGHTDKAREQIVSERQGKKLSKLQKTNGSVNNGGYGQISLTPTESNIEKNKVASGIVRNEKTREEIITEREAKKLAKQASKTKNKEENLSQTVNNPEIKLEEKLNLEKPIIVPEKKPALSKAERRAIQEAQRAAKTKMLEQKNVKKPMTEATQKTVQNASVKEEISPVKDKTTRPILPSKLVEKTNEYKVKLFKHLDRENLQEKNHFINHAQIHPAIVQLGEQISTRTVVGSNARCVAFLKALKTLIQDYQTPPKKEFTRGLEENITSCVQYLHKCRPLAVSVSNAHKAVQSVLRHLSNDLPESELKLRLCEHIETYIRDQIEKAAQAISSFVQQKISNGDVILTFGCSSLIFQILEEAHNRKIDFRVIVVDSRPFCEGQELLRKLALKEIPCTYVLINAVGFIMPEVTKILMGAHALLANGYVMARTGTAQVALVAKSFNVPVLVCCETHKFSERVQTDAIVYNELGNPDDLVINKTCKLANWQKGANKILPLNLNYDITPPELVTAVVTEVAILPCTSVPVILRLKPTDFAY